MKSNKLFTRLPKYVKHMTRQELLEYFPEGGETKTNSKGKEFFSPYTTNSFLLRSVIMNELEFNRHADTRTLRGVWYQCVKPVLDKLGKLTDEDSTEEGLTKWDASLSKYVCDLLRRGMLTFSDLSINDISRNRSNPSISHFTTDISKYGYQASVAPYPNIIIATEKDTVFSIIRNISDLLGLSCISCKGQNSLGAMEGLIRGIMYSDAQFDDIIILTLTDYDPAGYYIAGALEGQARDILKALGKEHDYGVKIERLGITPNQLDDEQVLQNMYTPKKANMSKWMDLTGGINGEEKGLELDALSSQQIRDIFIEGIEPYIDTDKYLNFAKEAYLKELFLSKSEKIVDAAWQRFRTQYLELTTIEDFDVIEIAKNGRRTIIVSELGDVDAEIGAKEMRKIYRIKKQK